MQKAQVFLREDQKKELRAIAARTGTRQSELIRRGVDLLIEEEHKQQTDWKAAWRQAYGMWKDREDLDECFQGIREDIKRRHERLFS